MAKSDCSDRPSVMVVVAVMAPMVVPFVMAAAPVPAMVTAMAAVSVAMMPATVFDLDYGPVPCGQGAMPILADADRVIANVAIKAAPIRFS